jgi:putative membrane protein
MSDRRFPRSVYGVGDEPDPRFSLANERTFLAWIRTSLALLAVGIAIEALAVGLDPVARFVSGLIFIVLAAVSVINSWLSWRRTERSLRQNRALPGLTTGAILVGGVIIGILVFVAGMLL